VTFKRKEISPVMNEGLANIALDSKKHEKYAFQAQINIGLSETGTFLHIWIIRHKYKRIYKKWFGVLS
jgi:hypothetical protein